MKKSADIIRQKCQTKRHQICISTVLFTILTVYTDFFERIMGLNKAVFFSLYVKPISS